jgi:hypothetical protein
MSEKPHFAADLLLALWVFLVGLIYFGGFFIPALGALTQRASAFYALMVLVSALAAAQRYLRNAPSSGTADKRAKKK